MGHNSEVEHADRRFQVQTEVVGRRAINIRTTVVAGGLVLLCESQPCPVEGTDTSAARALVAALHRSVVGRVKRGEFGGR